MNKPVTCPKCHCSEITETVDGGWRCNECKWDSYHQLAETNSTMVALVSPPARPHDYIVDMKEILDALENMTGAFDTPFRRIKFPGPFQDEVCTIARDVLRKFGRR